MTEEPPAVIIDEKAQPTTGSGHKKRPPAVHFQEPGSAQQHIVFTGSVIQGLKPDKCTFTALADEGAPTITGGYGEWTELERPQRESLPVLTRYSTLTMSVPILFEALVANHVDDAKHTPNVAGAALEADISVLEWMGGRGHLMRTQPVGVTPLVRVYSVGSKGNESPLIPPGAQGVTWIVAGIAFDPNPIRNRGGFRVRQAVVVVLKRYVARPGDVSPDGAAARLRAQKADRGRIIIHAKQGLDTVQQIASKVLNEPNAAHKITRYNERNNPRWKYGPSAEKHLPIDTEVWVPKSVADGLGWPPE